MSTTRRNNYIAQEAKEIIFRRVTRKIRGLRTDGDYFSRLRFADDILVCANTPQLQELADESENRGLKMNKSKKTKTMPENDHPLPGNTADWTVFAKHHDIFKCNIGTSLKRTIQLMDASSKGSVQIRLPYQLYRNPETSPRQGDSNCPDQRD